MLDENYIKYSLGKIFTIEACDENSLSFITCQF